MRISAGDDSGTKSQAACISRSNPFDGFMLPFVVSALLAARMIVPTESGARGDTLWITQLWFVAALMWSLLRITRKTAIAKPDLLDVAVWLIVVGHVVSALVVVNGSGDKRAALNMMWEWLALGMSFTLLRQFVSVDRHRRQLTVGMFSIVFCLALLGFWQHFVFYSQTGTAYSRDRGELDRMIALQVDQPSPGRELRIQDLQRSMQAQGIPLAGQDRILFEQRLWSSSEPFGPFALANSFAGLLAGWLVVLLLGVVIRRHQPRAGRISGVILLTAIGWCLLLTKSRTAWVGCLVGSVVGLVLAKSGVKRRDWLVAFSVLVAVGLVAVLGNGLDREVISEAPKSLKYRLEYWVGSFAVVKNSPIFGTGPGNFRQHYLRHKLPGSSEEISDPHNSILDAWANGGLLALVGLGLLGVCVIQGLSLHDEGQWTVSATTAFEPVGVGLAAGFVLVVAWDWLNGQMSDFRNLFLLGSFILTMTISSRMLSEVSIPSNVFAAGAVALLMALLGAGGFGMPAIFQCVLILVSLCFRRSSLASCSNVPASEGRLFGHLVGFALPAVLLSLLLACLQTGFGPVIQSRLSTDMGQRNLRQGRMQLGLRHLQRAVDFDPIGPDGFQQLGAAQLNEWMNSGRTDLKLLDEAIDNCRQSVALDPLSPGRRRILANYLRADGGADRLIEAVGEMEMAADVYPNSSEFQADLALILIEAGDSRSSVVAARALQLDELNRRLGHRDRYLPDQLAEILRRMVDEKGD
jgi:hypothetical protein